MDLFSMEHPNPLLMKEREPAFQQDENGNRAGEAFAVPAGGDRLEMRLPKE